MNIENTTTTFTVGDHIIRRRDGKIGEIVKIRDAELCPYSVRFPEDDPDTHLSAGEMLPATADGMAEALEPRVEEEPTIADVHMSDKEILESLDKTYKGEIRQRLAVGLIKRHRSIENALYTLETTDTDPRTIAANLDLQGIPLDDDEDEALPVFPEFTGSLAEMTDALCPDLPNEFKFMALATHFGLCRSGLDALESEPHLQPRQNTLFIKEAGSGKSASCSETRRIMQGVSTRYALSSSVDSGPALVDEFAAQSDKMKNSLVNDRAARVLIDCDEFSGLVEKGKTSRQTNNSLFSEILKLYEGNRTGNHARSSGKGKIEIDNAHLAILAGATPETYSSLWTATGGAASGLQSRFTLVTTRKFKIPAQQRPSDGDKMCVAMERLREQVARPEQKIKITPDAAQIFQEWWDAGPRDKASEIRIPDIVKRLLIVLATTNDTNVIDVPLMRQGIAFGDYQIAVRERFNPADASSWTQAFENEIERVFKRRGEMTLNEARRCVHPNRKPGGVGPFLTAFRNLVDAGILKKTGRTEKGTVKYSL